MNHLAIGIDINIKHIEAAIIDIASKSILPNTTIYKEVDCNGTAEDLIFIWAETIREVQQKCTAAVSKIGMAIPGPFDYNRGISLMKNQQKFDALYGLNVKELLAGQLNIPSENFRLDNNGCSFLLGEAMAGAAKGYKNVLAYTLDSGFATAHFANGVVKDLNLWNSPFKDGIAEDYFDTKWIAHKYEQYLDIKISNLKQITELSKTDGGIAWLVFNEYGENFAKFLNYYIKLYQPDLLLIGGNNEAWDLFIPHVKDRLYDNKTEVPIKQSILGDEATLIGAGFLWGDPTVY